RCAVRRTQQRKGFSGCDNCESPGVGCLLEAHGCCRRVHRVPWKRCDMGFKALEDSERWPDDGESSWRGTSCFGNAVRGVRGVSEVRADSWSAGERNIRPEPRSAGAHLKGQRRRTPKSKRSLQMGVPIPVEDRQRKRG